MPGGQLACPPRVLGGIVGDHHAGGGPDLPIAANYQDRAPGVVDDSLRNAAHEQALHAAKTPASDDHEVRFRLLGGAQDLAHRRARQEPSIGHRAPHLLDPPHLLFENPLPLLHALGRGAHPERHARELPG